jgi:hypothetical protein
VGREVCEGLSDRLYESVKSSGGGFAEGCFELGEGLFDWIEIGAVGRQVAKRRAGSLDRFFDAGDFVTGEIIHDDDIARAQGRDEKMLDISQEACSIYRPIKDTGRGDLILAKRGKNVVVIQWPCGTGATSRCPRGARPKSRTILVFAPVSSMNTRRPGFRPGWLARHSSRALATSARSCSAARNDFF